MAEETTTAEAEAKTEEKAHEETVPYDRFDKANKQAREFKQRATQLENTVAELKAAMEEREQAGLPELERFKKDLERAQARADAAEAKAAETEQKLARTAKSNLVRAAAKGFADPDDAVAFVDLDGIEDEKDAERAVKALAKQKPHLLKSEDPKLPGRVLQNGQPTVSNGQPNAALLEAQILAEGLKQYASQD